ncbi:hypothetical protein [Glycomyces harbinensis]|uniref:MYXO-CTERM domain-containing protein n=1 Tax=Glycomyces harbinensis TaxID=58114 RepID=A0A1G7APT6_9ACTN|nr:hypothetical protein [Glycomyces harbinensis]SDE15906.1 hypothetical protein SAMN05216270_11432 [Glycomyces harbinensis]
MSRPPAPFKRSTVFSAIAIEAVVVTAAILTDSPGLRPLYWIVAAGLPVFIVYALIRNRSARRRSDGA